MKKITYILSDEVSHHLFFSRVLGNDYECYEVSTNELNINEFKHFVMDLIIINDTPRNCSLYSLLRTLRNSGDLSMIPIIVITNRLKKNVHKKLKRSGATTIMIEPLSEVDTQKAITEGLAFHQVVEKTSQLQKPSSTQANEQLLQEQSVIDVKVIEQIQASFEQTSSLSVIMGKIVLLKTELQKKEEIEKTQEIIAKGFKEKTLFFLSNTEFFFSSNLDIETIKLHCKRIKESLSSFHVGVCYGIATKPKDKESSNVKDFLKRANKNLDQALKHPNTIIAN